MADLKLLITIPEAYAGRPAMAISSNRNYQAILTAPDGEQYANPLTRMQVAANVLLNFIKEEMIAYEVPDLAKSDRQAKVDEINAISITIEVVP